jgi:hypothetical protein
VNGPRLPGAPKKGAFHPHRAERKKLREDRAKGRRLVLDIHAQEEAAKARALELVSAALGEYDERPLDWRRK